MAGVFGGGKVNIGFAVGEVFPCTCGKRLIGRVKKETAE